MFSMRPCWGCWAGLDERPSDRSAGPEMTLCGGCRRGLVACGRLSVGVHVLQIQFSVGVARF